MICPVLLEGHADMPVMRALLTRRFGLKEGTDFRLHPHRGKGKLSPNLLGEPDPKHQGLLDQLPSKLKGLSNHPLVVVLMDLDNGELATETQKLASMLERLPKHPERVLFCFAIEETESWLIADLEALKKAYPDAKTQHLKKIEPDQVVGAWEKLATALGHKTREGSRIPKMPWAEKIAPHMDFFNPRSPSLKKVINDLDQTLPEAKKA